MSEQNAQSVLVPTEVITAAWVGLVGALGHAHRSCNEGVDVKCFVCEGLTALRPYHHRSAQNEGSR